MRTVVALFSMLALAAAPASAKKNDKPKTTAGKAGKTGKGAPKRSTTKKGLWTGTPAAICTTAGKSGWTCGAGAPLNIAQSYTGKRSASGYLKVLKLFNVTKSPRYQAGSTTYCHIFVQDVTWASGALVSHAFDAKTGANATFAWGKNVWKDGIEHDANSVVDWFNGAGSKTYGWRKLASGADAQASADKGIPVVAAWKNPTAAGHVAMVIPSSARVTKTAGTITMAGAGVTNHFGDDISEVFKAAPLADVQFFEHK